MKTKRLKINMAYCYVGETFIDVPEDLSLEDAYIYARENIGDIPLAESVDYVPDSDEFDLCDCEFEEE